MSIGPDIRDIFQELGTSYTILKPNGEIITGEKLDYKVNAQVTKPFIREFFLEASFSYDSKAVSGDIIQLKDGRKFLIMNFTPENFEDELVEFFVVLYKINEEITIFRQINAGRLDNYRPNFVWQKIKVNIPILLTNKLYGSRLDQEELFGQLAIDQNEVYISGFEDIRTMDKMRIYDQGGGSADWDEEKPYNLGEFVYLNTYEYKSLVNENLGNDPELDDDESFWYKIPHYDLKIEEVERRKFDNISMCRAVQDTRE